MEPHPRPAAHHPNSTASPAGSLRGLLSRTLIRGRSTEHVPRRKQKSRPSSPDPNRHAGETTTTAAFSVRSRSTSWSAHGPKKLSKDGKCCSARTSSARNPPPFAEALRHAILHAKLETLVLSANVRRDKSAASTPLIGTDAHASPRTGVGRSSQSSPGGYNLAYKVFVLTDDGCILQYQPDGASNRVPERILELGPQSISVASDAIPGKHWVLNVVYDGRHDAPQPGTNLKPSRSRLFSRIPSGIKRHAREMLLVFADDAVFDQWLICVRKEIEALGGLEYRPDSRNAAALLQCAEPGTQFNVPPTNGPPRQTQHPPATSRDLWELQAHTYRTTSSRPAVESSEGPNADLGKPPRSTLLESSAGSSSVAASHEQPIPDINIVATESSQASASVSVPSAKTRRQKHIQPIIIFPGSRSRSLSCSPSLPSPQFPRTPTLAVDAVQGMAGDFGKPVSPVSPTMPVQPDQSPFTFMEQFRFTPYTRAEVSPNAERNEPGYISIQQTPRESFSTEDASPQYLAEFDSFAGDHQSISTRASTEGAAGDQETHTPPVYTLATQRYSSLPFRAAKSKTETSSQTCLIGLGISTPLYVDSSQEIFVFPDKPDSLDPFRPPSEYKGSLFAPPPEVLPMSNHAEALTGSSNTPEQARQDRVRKMSRQRSMPNMLTVSGAPLAPPPSVPLPAIPNHDSKACPARRGRSLSPPSHPSTQHHPTTHHTRSSTLDSPHSDRTSTSPLQSHPVSSAELKFARRLSTFDGFTFPAKSAAAAALPPPPPSSGGGDENTAPPPRRQKRSTSKSPPPSTWEAWKSFPRLMRSTSSLRQQCSSSGDGSRSTTPPPPPPPPPVVAMAPQQTAAVVPSMMTTSPSSSTAVPDGSADGVPASKVQTLRKRARSLAAGDVEMEARPQGGGADAGASGWYAGRQQRTAAEQEEQEGWQTHDERQGAGVTGSTIEINGFRFPVAL